MKLLILISMLLICLVRSKFIESFISRDLQTATCPKLTIKESYQLSYGSTTIIQPTYTTVCSGVTYTINSASITNKEGLTSTGATRGFKVSDWSQFLADSYYNVTIKVVFKHPNQSEVEVNDYFFIVIGSSNILFKTKGALVYSYNETFTVDYSDTLDVLYPKTSTLTYTWACMSNFEGCSTLGAVNNFDEVSRIKTFKMLFDFKYDFIVTIRNTAYNRAVTDRFSIMIKSPQSQFSSDSCIVMGMNYLGLQSSLTWLQSNMIQLTIDSLNITDFKIGQLSFITTQCSPNDIFQSLSTVSQNNNLLFNDLKQLEFNQASFSIKKETIYDAFLANKNQELTFYYFMLDGNQIVRYQYITIKLQLDDKSLYAVAKQNFIIVEMDKILYLDGSLSYDAANATNTRFTYQWSLLQQPNTALPQQQRLTIYPSDRSKWGMNSPGSNYTYLLKVSDSTKQSAQIKIIVKIRPITDSNNCVVISVNEITDNLFITAPYQELDFLSVISNKNCGNTKTGVITWSQNQLPQQLWTLNINNRTATMSSASLSSIPKSWNLTITVSIQYYLGTSEYQSSYSFNLFILREYLFPLVDLQTTINFQEQNLRLDASGSYGTYDAQIGNSKSAVCEWRCPSVVQTICDRATYSSNNCVMSLSSVLTLQSSSYQQLINQALPFFVSITKGNYKNSTTSIVFVQDYKATAICSINTIKNFSPNQYAIFNASCPTGVQSYKWSIQDSSDNVISDIPSVQYDQSFLYIPPYVLNNFEQVKLMVSVKYLDGTQTQAINKYVNYKGGFQIGTLLINFNQVVSYLTNLILTPINTTSIATNKARYQVRIKQIDNQLPIYRTLVSNMELDTLKPLTIQIPVLTYENALYFDVMDTEGNYQTIRQPLNSKPDILLNSVTMNTRVTNLLNSFSNTFNETEFELNIYRLWITFDAYGRDHFNNQSQPAQFFRNISENATLYMYNYLIADQRLDDIRASDRISLIKQNVIEIAWQMTKKNRDMRNIDNLYEILKMVVNDEFYVGNMMLDTTIRIHLIFQNLQTLNYNSVYDAILVQMYKSLGSFMFQNQYITYSSLDGYQVHALKLSNVVTTIPDITGYTFNKNVLLSKAGKGGLFYVVKNDSFIFVQLLNSNYQYVSVTGLSAAQSNNVTFKLSSVQLQKYLDGGLGISCASKETLSGTYSNVTSKIKIVSINNDTGEILCNANHFSLYTLVTWNRPISSTINNTNNSTGGNNQSTGNNSTNNITNNTNNNNHTDQDQDGTGIGGKWNDTLGPQQNISNIMTYSKFDPLIFEQQAPMMTSLAIITLLVFIAINLGFCIKFKTEHQDYDNSDQKPDKVHYDSTKSPLANKCNLFKRLMEHFNPYSNLFTIYNQYLQRWVRSTLVQIYFMTLSLVFGVNSSLLTYHLSSIGEESQIQLIGIIFIGIALFSIIRPWCIEFFYKMLYEAGARVYIMDNTAQVSNDLINQEKVIQDFVAIDMSPKQFKQDNRLSDVIKQFDINNRQLDRSDLSGDANNVPFSLRRSLKHSDDEDVRQTLQMDDSKISFNQDGQKKKLSKLKKMINDKPLAFNKQEESLNSFKQATFNYPSKIGPEDYNPQSQSNFMPQDQSFSDEKYKRFAKHDNRNDDNDLKLPTIDIHGGKRKIMGVTDSYEKSTLDRPQQDNLESSQPKVIERNYFEEFNLLVDQFDTVNEKIHSKNAYDDNQNVASNDNLIQPTMFEGGSEEEEEDQDHAELDRDESDNDDMTSHRINHNVEALKRTSPQSDNQVTLNQFVDGGPIQTNQSLSKTTYDRIKGSKVPIENEYHRKKLDEVVFKQKIKEKSPLFINKIIGKAMLILCWTLLIIGNIFSLKYMSQERFIEWLILSLVAFVFIQLVLDPLLYWILASIMVEKEQINFFENNFKCTKCSEIFIVLFIGKAKMRDFMRIHGPKNNDFASRNMDNKQLL
ncbi:UNKNOWN [Stylonychia lemnae]|uniref:Cadg domain containing protein n=1 Tax=Stylonychia lemnae TaxID=5949 RepID=A0A078B301_STYLE|nr:UNKNOWN [Stylonychia lemnae]|eukprot:CDW88880.1 UNKNOWN [Stylonychia lemnae]